MDQKSTRSLLAMTPTTPPTRRATQLGEKKKLDRVR